MTGVLRTALVLLLAPLLAHAVTFPVLDGDPVDPGTGDAYLILPGRPLITAPLHGHGETPVVDPSKIGDVDLVVRAGTPMVGPGIPAPAASPVTGTTDSTKVGGVEIPFTVVVSDGKTPAPVGSPLLGAEMDGLPVVVFAFADLDGDGFVGPTAADPDGTADDDRELQEALYPVGRQVAVFTNGVATGSIAITTGAPASAGGLHVVLTAGAYVGSFSAAFGAGNIPVGPPILTSFPFLPNSDASTIVEGGGRGGRAASDVRFEIALEPVVPPLVGDPTLGTPFAIPTDGSDATVDRAVVTSGAFVRPRFVRPSVAAGFPTGAPVDVRPGAGGALVEPLTNLDVPDDGPGGTVTARLVPVDRLNNVTDPPAGTTVTLLADPRLLIVAPDNDGDPSHETVALDDAGGVVVTLGDAGGANDSGTGATLTVVSGGFPVESLAIAFTPAAGVTTTTTIASTTSTSTSSTTTTVAATSTSSTSTSSTALTTTSTTSTTVLDTTSTSTSSTIAPTTSTSTTLAATTTSSSSSSSTSVPASTTSTTTSSTTTTLPQGCAAAPSFAGSACRLAALSAAIDTGVPAGRLQNRLTTFTGRARIGVNLAEQQVAGQHMRQARNTLRAATRALTSLARDLGTRAAKRTLSADVRSALMSQSSALLDELRTLRSSL